MRFPDNVTVVARDRETGRSVKDIAIVLILFAMQKNDYYVGPLITNGNGQVEFSRAKCNFAIKRAQEMFVMDYAGDLESCRPVIEVRLHSPKHIQGMLQQYRQSPDFWGRAFPDPVGFFAALAAARNGDYADSRITATEEHLFRNPELVLPLLSKTGEFHNK